MLLKHGNVNNHNDCNEDLLFSSNENDNHCAYYHLLIVENDATITGISSNNNMVKEGNVNRQK